MRRCLLSASEMFGLSAKRVSIIPGHIPVWDVRNCSLLLNVSSSNNLIELSKEGEVFYFRFTPPRPPKDSVVASIISRFEKLTETDLSAIKNELSSSIKAKVFLNMGDFTPESRIYKCFASKNLSLVGLNNCILNCIEEKKVWGFLYFAWSEICAFKKNRFGGKYQLFSYYRSRCQKEIYELFGVPELICGIDLYRIKGKNNCLIGSVMRSAVGVNPLSFGKGEIMSKLSPKVIRDLNTLNILDVLCNERDHRPGNYNVVLDNSDRICSIQAFDNDSDLSFFPFFSVNRPLRGCPGLVDNNGHLTISHLDNDFAIRFLSITPRALQGVVTPYLNRIQTIALLIRFIQIRKSLLKTINENRCFLKRSNEWSEMDLEYELSSETDNNYTKLLANWYEGEKDPIILAQNNWEKLPIVL